MTIDKPGVFDLSMAEYHGQPTVGHSVSGSGLVKIEQTSLAHYNWHRLNPDDSDSPALAFGRAFHCLLLEGSDAFHAAYAVKPAGMNFATTEGKRWKVDHAGREIISDDNFQRAEAMVAAVRNHPLCGKVFRDGKPERSLIWKDEPTGVWLKARPDWLPQLGQTIANLKSAGSLHPETWERDAIKYGYHQGAALMADGLRAVLGWEKPVPYFIVQEKEPPYLVAPVVIDDDVIAWGRLLNRRALDRLARALETDHWPGYTEGVMTVRMPAWAETKLQRRHEAGEFSEVDKARQGPIT